MPNFETRIYLPQNVADLDIHEHYADFLGRVILEIVSRRNDWEWFWFTRYDSNDSDTDCVDIAALPNQCRSDLSALQSVRFRFGIPDHNVDLIRAMAMPIVAANSCGATTWQPYTENLGGTRFRGGNSRTSEASRAEAVRAYFHAISKLVLDSLVLIQGCYVFETNSDPINPLHSNFESLIHLFCNTAEIPLLVVVKKPDASSNSFVLQTNMSSEWADPTIAGNLAAPTISHFPIYLKF